MSYENRQNESTAGIQLLIADDEQFIRRGLLSLDWRSIGVTKVHSADTGEQAREILCSQPVDIAILDIRMPGVSGLELAETIEERALDTRVVLLTGFSEFSYAQRAIHAGVDEYLLKPFGPKEILSVIAKLVHEVEQTREQQRILTAAGWGEESYLDVPSQVGGFFSNAKGVVNDILMDIANGYAGPISISELADRYHFTENYLSKKLRQETGYSFTDILLALRLMSAARHLVDGDKVADAATASGFNDQHYFAQVFRRVFKVSPSDWRQQNPDAVLHFHEVLDKVVAEKNSGSMRRS